MAWVTLPKTFGTRCMAAGVIVYIITDKYNDLHPRCSRESIKQKLQLPLDNRKAHKCPHLLQEQMGISPKQVLPRPPLSPDFQQPVELSFELEDDSRVHPPLDARKLDPITDPGHRGAGRHGRSLRKRLLPRMCKWGGCPTCIKGLQTTMGSRHPKFVMKPNGGPRWTNVADVTLRVQTCSHGLKALALLVCKCISRRRCFLGKTTEPRHFRSKHEVLRMLG